MEKRKNRKLELKLKPADNKRLEILLRGGVESVRVIKRARILQLLNDGFSSNGAAAAIGVTPETARKIGWRYNEQGLENALYERPRPGNPPLLDKEQESQIIAIACSSPPPGAARWTTALLAKAAMKAKIVPHISRETVRLVLKHHDLKPWREKNVVYSGRA